jgi:predicted small lipoprotein YifL
MEARTQSFLLALVLAVTLAGCGSKSEPTPTPSKAAAPVRKVATPADSLSPYLVSAVTTAKSGAGLLQLKFELAARPQVGDPVDVDLVIVPQADNITQISGTVQGDDGLEVLSGDTIAPAEKITFGTPIHHALKVRAKRDGIFTLSAAMTVESGGQMLAPVYSMPLIAGNGLADTGSVPAKSPPKPVPPTAAK